MPLTTSQAIEAQYGQPLAVILRTGLEKHGSMRALARALGISPQTLYTWWRDSALPDPALLKRHADVPRTETTKRV